MQIAMEESLYPSEKSGTREDAPLKKAEEQIRQLQILVAELLLKNQILRADSEETG